MHVGPHLILIFQQPCEMSGAIPSLQRRKLRPQGAGLAQRHQANEGPLRRDCIILSTWPQVASGTGWRVPGGESV